MKKSLSIIVAAYNEERNIVSAITDIIRALKNTITDYEIIIVNDGSTDKTQQVVESILKKKSKVKLINLKVNKGLGYSFCQGVKAATKTYLGPYPGDNDMSSNSLRQLISQMQEADIITGYMSNPHKRSWLRQLLSKTFVFLLNTCFDLQLKYYNGPFICKTSLVKQLSLKSQGHTIYAELKIRIIKSKHSYKEIPFEHTGRIHDQSKAISFKNLFTTAQIFLILFRDLYLKKLNI